MKLHYIIAGLLAVSLPLAAQAQVIPSLPYIFAPGQTIASSQVNADLATIRNAVNAWAAGGAGSGTITAVNPGAGLSGGGSSGAVTLGLAATAVTAGSYTCTSFTVNAYGQITAASSGTCGSGNGTVTSITFGTGLTGGTITGSGSVALASVASPSVLSNISGSSAAPVGNTVTAILDSVFTTTEGAIIQRGASVWQALAPGTSGYFLKSQGAGSLLTWAAGGTVSSITAGNGLSGGTITGSGTVAISAPVSVANGGTNATTAGATAANNIGALAEANNLSDVASAASALANIGGNNASNITNGTLPNAQMPTPTLAGGLGGVAAVTSTAHNWLSYINTSGIAQLSQPAFSDISGTAANAQMPTPTASALGGIESATTTAHQWIYAITTAGVPLQSQPAVADLTSVGNNTILGNPTSVSAAPQAMNMPSCSAATSALTWTTNSGFGCNTISGGSGSPGGSNTDVQYNNAGVFGGNSGFVYDGSKTITLGTPGSTVGGVAFANATSGTITLNPTTGALGSAVLTLPDVTDTLATIGSAQTISGLFTFNTGKLAINGGSATAGIATVTSGGVISSAAPNWTTMFSPNTTGSSAGSAQTASWTVPEIVAATSLGGTYYYGSALSLSFNGAGTGANGMDTGSMPSGGALYIYAIYNPSTATWKTLGTTTAPSSGSPIYGGSNPVSGYTASVLIWSGVTTGTNFIAFSQKGRSVAELQQSIFSGATGVNSTTSQSVSAAVPPNALTCTGYLSQSQSTGTAQVLQVSAASTSNPSFWPGTSLGTTVTGNTGQAWFIGMPFSTAQTVYWYTGNTTASSTSLAITGYTF